jgi:hypothetical protein
LHDVLEGAERRICKDAAAELQAHVKEQKLTNLELAMRTMSALAAGAPNLTREDFLKLVVERAGSMGVLQKKVEEIWQKPTELMSLAADASSIAVQAAAPDEHVLGAKDFAEKEKVMYEMNNKGAKVYGGKIVQNEIHNHFHGGSGHQLDANTVPSLIQRLRDLYSGFKMEGFGNEEDMGRNLGC